LMDKVCNELLMWVGSFDTVLEEKACLLSCYHMSFGIKCLLTYAICRQQ